MGLNRYSPKSVCFNFDSSKTCLVWISKQRLEVPGRQVYFVYNNSLVNVLFIKQTIAVSLHR